MYKKLVPFEESPVVVFGNLYMMNLSELRDKLNKKPIFIHVSLTLKFEFKK